MTVLYFNLGPDEKFTDDNFRYLFIYLLFIFVFLGPHPWHMEVPQLGVESEL